MESLYYVMSWACHRRCKHCYEQRFRPYVRDERESVVAEAEANFPRLSEHFPERMTFPDREDPRPDGSFPEKTGRIVLSGGEALLDPVRTRVTYPVIDRLNAEVVRYLRSADGQKRIVGLGADVVANAPGEFNDLVVRELAKWRKVIQDAQIKLD